MLYLPLGIRNFIEERAISRTANMGSFLIEIVCKWAWENGYSCDHPGSYLEPRKEESKEMGKPVYRCKICGMKFTKDVSRRGGGDSLKKLGYPIVGFVGKK